MLNGMLNTSKSAGFFRIGSKGEDLGMRRWFGTEEQQKKLWEHTLEVTKVKA
jgi:hypothetical protein